MPNTVMQSGTPRKNACWKLKLPILTAVLILGFNVLVEAGIENRPINVDDAWTLDALEFTTASGFVYTRADNGDGETDLTLDFGFGITDRLEVTAQIPYVFLHPESGKSAGGYGDIQLRPEFALWQEQTYLPAASVAGVVKFQNGNDEKSFGSGQTDWTVSGQLSKSLGQFTFHTNVAFTNVGEAPGSDLDNVIFYGFASEYSLTERLTLMGEVFGETNSEPSAEENPVEFLAAFAYDLPWGFTLDFGVGAGLNNGPSPDLKITSGVSYSYQFN